MNISKQNSQDLNANKQPLEKLAYRIREVQAVTGLSRSTVYALIAQGKLKAVSIGGCRLILAEDLRKLLEGR